MEWSFEQIYRLKLTNERTGSDHVIFENVLPFLSRYRAFSKPFWLKNMTFADGLRLYLFNLNSM